MTLVAETGILGVNEQIYPSDNCEVWSFIYTLYTCFEVQIVTYIVGICYTSGPPFTNMV